MALELFGYQLKKAKTGAEKKEDEKKVSFVMPADQVDGGYSLDAGGHFGQFLDTSGSNFKSEVDLIMRYRESAMLPEIDAAVEDIVSEAIISDEDSAPVELNTDDMELNDKVKSLLRDEFEEVVALLNFNWYGHEIFRRWYVDGRLYYHKIIDRDNPKNGLVEVRPIDPTKIRRVKEPVKSVDPKTGVTVVERVDEYFVYNQGGSSSTQMGLQSQGVKVNSDAITFCSSGVLDPTRSYVVGHLHKALKNANQLKMLEDALVVYRLARAPERRIFYVDVGNLPKGKAEEYVNGIMSKYRNKMVYDATTGEMRDDRKHLSMLEDFWLPRREGSRGTEISTLPGGENLGQIEDILYFQKKLYKSMGVPLNRLNTEDNAMVSLGRASETTREELKYQRFIDRLRKRFSTLFIDILKTQVIVKGIMTHEEWEQYSQDISVNFMKSSHFAELAEGEILRERIETLNILDQYVGRYFSTEWVRKNILRQTDEDIEDMDQQLKDEPDLHGDVDEYQERYRRTEEEIRQSVLKEVQQNKFFENLNDFINDDASDSMMLENIKKLASDTDNGS